MIRRIMASLLFVALLGAAPTVFTAPAGDRFAGAFSATPFDVILPNGRILAPAGTSVAVGMNALGVALAPDGRYAIVSNDDEREASARNAYDPRVTGGYSLAVVNTATMAVSDVYVAPKGESFFAGVRAFADPIAPDKTLVLASQGPSNTVRLFELTSDGKLSPQSSFAIPLATDARLASNGHAFPGSITLSRNEKYAYVVNNISNTVTAIDLAGRVVLGTEPVGFFPYDAAISGSHLLVSNEGLMEYSLLPQPVRVPQFAVVGSNPEKASSLTMLALGSDGNLVPNSQQYVAMDPAPDGDQSVGGAHPSAIVSSPDGRYAYVAMSNVDRIATVSLSGVPRVIGGLQLRLFDRAPYGTQPDALAINRSGKILYAALAGINAVAVIDAHDPAHLHRIGLIPTGWYPAALALSHDDRFLYVANAKGYGGDPGFEGDGPFSPSSRGRMLQVRLDSNDIWATLQRIDLRRLPIVKTTMSTLRYLRTPKKAAANAVVPPLRSLRPSSVIKHVVLILEENKTYDSMLGDLKDAAGRPHGAGDPALVSFDVSVTPNLHALARDFGVAVNEYADAQESDAGHQFAAAGIASEYSEKTLLVKSGRFSFINKNENPEDYPRAGYIFNSLRHANKSFRDYGDLLRVSGYDDGRASDVRADDPQYRNINDDGAATSGLGGLYMLNVPAPVVLADHVDLNYPGWNLRIRDARRAREFISDYGALEKAGAAPLFTYIWLPADHGGTGPGIPALSEQVADGDRALGMIVDYLSHLPEWSSTAIFVMPDDSQATRDHISEQRSYVVVISPHAKRHYIGHHHLSTVSVLKTEEELLGLPPLSLGDMLATDMSDFFTAKADTSPYSNIPVPTQSASAEGARIAELLQATDQSAPDADTHRTGALIDLSRRADKLAASKKSMEPTRYADMQARLYRQALHVVKMEQ